MRVIKVSGVIILLLFIAMIFTNPTLRDFNEFIPTHARIPYKGYKAKLNVAKKANYIIYSVYEYEILEEVSDDEFEPRESGEFTGFLKNFYKVQHLPTLSKTTIKEYSEDGLPIFSKEKTDDSG